jgi:His/Glu/Gln/Arg/opine family amino acid ABC transporter permease subunit
MGGLDFDVIERSWGYLFREGMTFTLTLTGLAALGGIIFGTLLAMMRLSSHKWLQLPATGYVNLMRSIPLLLVIFWFYFLVPYIGAWIVGSPTPIKVGAFASSVITFTLFEAAYYSEIMRAGIQSIARGQVWAGYALGLDYWQSMRYIVLPQAFRNNHPVPGHLARLRAFDHRFSWRGIEGRTARWSAGRNVPVRGGGVLHHELLAVVPREIAAEKDRNHSLGDGVSMSCR